METSYYVYKYEHKGEIVYIGQTINLYQRIFQHRTEEKFQPYLTPNDCNVFFHKCASKTEMNWLESALINTFRPILNIRDNSPVTPGVTVQGVCWEEFTSYTEDEFVTPATFVRLDGVSRQAVAQRQKTSLRPYVKEINRKKMISIEGLKSKNNYISVKEFATLAGITHQSVYKRLNKQDDPLQSYMKKIGNKIHLDKAALSAVYGVADAINSTPDLTDTLQQQFIDKQREIERLHDIIAAQNTHISELTSNLTIVMQMVGD